MLASALGEYEISKSDTATEPLRHLIQAVESLRTKTIPQAYFWLDSPQAPNSTIFFPDTDGGAFVLIARFVKLPNGADAEAALAELKKSWPSLELPILDKKNNRLLYYGDEAWHHLEATMRPWSIPAKKIEGLAASNQWDIDQNNLFIEIPRENAETFYDALMKAWNTDKERFRCFAGWN